MKNRFDQKAKEPDEHPIVRDTALKFSQTLRNHAPVSGNTHILDYGFCSGLIDMHLSGQLCSSA